MTLRIGSGKLLGRGLLCTAYRGLGVPYAVIDAQAGEFTNPIKEDFDGTDGPGDEYCYVVTEIPATGTLSVFDDSSLTFVPAADGIEQTRITVLKNLVAQGSKKIYFSTGADAITPQDAASSTAATQSSLADAGAVAIEPEDASSSTSASQASLANASSIEPADSTSGTQASQSTLGNASNIEPADASSGTSASQSSLTDASMPTVEPADATAATSASQAGLTANSMSIEPADATSSSAASSPSLVDPSAPVASVILQPQARVLTGARKRTVPLV
jgi:hypothetical protein